MTLSLDLAPADAERYARLRAFRQSWWDAGRGDPPLTAVDTILPPVTDQPSRRKKRASRGTGRPRPVTSKVGVRGVTLTREGTYRVDIKRKPDRYRLGTYKTLAEAAKVAARAYDRIERGLEP